MLNILKSNSVYVGVLEVKPLSGCQLDPCEYTGAAVRVYVPAVDELSAKNLLMDSLCENHFELIEIEFFVNKDDVEWENPDDPIAQELSEEALELNEVVYGEFNAWDES